MKLALVNPNWTFEGSIYFGCREPHLPLELGYARQLLEAAGHEALLLDAQLEQLDLGGIRDRLDRFNPDAIVVTTAPSYLFWRCAPPELRVPQLLLHGLADYPGLRIAVGPHGSTTPRAVLAKLGVDAVVMGECEEALVRLAATPPPLWRDVAGVATQDGGQVVVNGGPLSVDIATLPALRWEPERIAAHGHHHHRFDRPARAPGAEIEWTRGCPYHCTFCAKTDFRDRYRRRPLPVVLEELDGLIEQGVEYVYFIDEIFLPFRPLLEALRDRPVQFGVQTRIDLWSDELLDLLGEAGCVSVEAGIEALSEAGRSALDKSCKLSTDALTAKLIRAKQGIAFVQGNLIDSGTDDPERVGAWRDELRTHGVWANEPVPMFAYPGSPDYRLRWGRPDDQAWERAVEDYLSVTRTLSDIQDSRPRPLPELELAPGKAAP